MGYGRSVSRFTERKRVVKDKNVGPLIRTDMTRCIHCTRCVRFLEEVAGTSEMGGSGRGDRLEIGTCIENSIDSEMSGNVIDLCPVGALTNKPFRYSARAWELRARPSVAIHDGVGSRLWYHQRRGKVLRAVPQDHEAANETWLSDRDRYSHFGLSSADRVTEPMLRQDGEWQTVSWDEAITATANALRQAAETGSIGALMNPSAATEDYYLGQRLLRGLGSSNIDHRLREQDFSDDVARPLAPRFETAIADIETADGILLIGSHIRHEAPILGHRVRKAWLAGAQVAALNPVDWDFHFELAQSAIVAPQAMVAELGALATAVAQETGQTLPSHLQSVSQPDEDTSRLKAMAKWLVSSERAVVIIGNVAMSHEQAAWLRQLGAFIATASGAGLNVLAQGGNAVGAWLAGAVPQRGAGGAAAVSPGLNARGMLTEPLDTYLLWDFEPDRDTSNPAMTMAALEQAKNVVAVSSFAGESLLAQADIILPLAPWVETGGTHYNLDGAALVADAAGTLSGQSRPGWKILRRLGAEMELDGFDQVNIEALHSEMKGDIDAAQAETADPELDQPAAGRNLHRVGEVSIYAVDALCRRSPPLQDTIHAASNVVRLNGADIRRLGLSNGGKARVQQGELFVEMTVEKSNRVPEGAAWMHGGTEAVAGLGDLSGPINVEVA